MTYLYAVGTAAPLVLPVPRPVAVKPGAAK